MIGTAARVPRNRERSWSQPGRVGPAPPEGSGASPMRRRTGRARTALESPTRAVGQTCGSARAALLPLFAPRRRAVLGRLVDRQLAVEGLLAVGARRARARARLGDRRALLGGRGRVAPLRAPLVAGRLAAAAGGRSRRGVVDHGL